MNVGEIVRVVMRNTDTHERKVYGMQARNIHTCMTERDARAPEATKQKGKEV